MEKPKIRGPAKELLDHFHLHNRGWLVRSLVFFNIYACFRIFHGYESIQNQRFAVGIPLAGLALILIINRLKYFRCAQWWTVTALAVFFAAANAFEAAMGGFPLWFFAFPYLLLLFRVNPWIHSFLYVVILAAGIFQTGVVMADPSLLKLVVLIGLISWPLALMDTAHKRKRFLIQYRSNHHDRERERMKKELDFARDIQMSLLPPSYPEPGDLDIACFSKPANEVGGDYFDYFQDGSGNTNLVIGDVSGQGVASGLVLSGVRSCLILLRDPVLSPSEVLAKLNRMLKKATDKRMFMTFLYLSYQPENNAFRFASAGHPPALLFQPHSLMLQTMKQAALPLGGLLSAEYKEDEIPARAGDLLVLYTDGLVEAHNAREQVYGLARLRGKIEEIGPLVRSAREAQELIIRDVLAFTGQVEQSDDMTLVVARPLR